MKRVLAFWNVAKGAGAIVLGLVALDGLAFIVTLAIGAEWLKR